VVFHGAAGDPREPHYKSQSTLWRHGATVPMHYDWAAVRHAALAHTHFEAA
jgi:penicillin amidase